MCDARCDVYNEAIIITLFARVNILLTWGAVEDASVESLISAPNYRVEYLAAVWT